MFKGIFRTNVMKKVAPTKHNKVIKFDKDSLTRIHNLELEKAEEEYYRLARYEIQTKNE